MRIPTTTYRIQFTPSFGFSRAKNIISYLQKLGITDLYASPIFKARQGSSHGYDVINPCMVNPELGSREEFNVLLGEVHSHGMGWLQDIVPNHMAFNGQNAWLMDVLEKGSKSEYWKYFDIEWKDTYQSLKGRILTPFLGQFYSQCLENKEIQLKYDRDGFTINYFDLSLPLKIESYSEVLLHNKEKLKSTCNGNPGKFSEYLNIVQKFSKQPKRKNYTDYVFETKRQLWDIYTGNKTFHKHINQAVAAYNGAKGKSDSFNGLDQLLSKQLFRLTFWKFGSEEINYRRFFNINQLISMRVEDSKVFARTHELIFDLLEKGQMTGLRVDHIDGLYDPKRYLKRLQAEHKDTYVVVEKILDHDEKIPDGWSVEGTTGYDFLNYLNGIYIKPESREDLNRCYQKVTGNTEPFAEIVSSKKRLIIGKHMAGDIDNLAHHMKRISHKDRYGRDITSYGLKRALVEVLSFFPIYRTYADKDGINDDDKTVILDTICRVKESNPSLVYELDYIKDILLLNFKDRLSEEEERNWMHFVRRFQQFTGPLMAKGFEDTALYVYNRFLSLNEVGGSPDHFGISLKKFHEFQKERCHAAPHTMNATATHDTKRGEDVRARMNVLSEIPRRWEKKVNLWRKLNKDKKTKLSGKIAPDCNDEHFFYQTLIGGFPFNDHDRKNNFKERLKEYIIKAVREAKIHTAWIQPDEKYESAYLRFIDKILKPSRQTAFYHDFIAFQKEIAHFGIFNSLSQTLVKMTSPGVPDFYQGCELWDFHFVDPDNRRPVDFRLRQQWLKQIIQKSQDDNLTLIKTLLKNKESGQIKLYLIWKILKLRNQQREVFQYGQYIPLPTKGKYKDCIIAFARTYKEAYTVTLAPRFLTNVVNKKQNPIGHVWGNTAVTLPKNDCWRDGLTGLPFNNKIIYMRDVFKHFPGAALMNNVM